MPTPDNSPLQLLELLLANPDRFGSAILIQSDRCYATSTDIIKSFSAGHMAEGMFIDVFADFLYKEDMSKTTHPANTRIFIPTTISALINIENVTRNGTNYNFKPDALVEQLHFALRNVEITRDKKSSTTTTGRCT